MTAAGEQSADVLAPGRHGASSLQAAARTFAWKAALPVVAAVVAAFAVYSVLSSFVESPRVYVDETRYVDAASSLAHGHGLEVRGEHYGWAPGYPVAISPIVLLSPDRSAAYLWIKLANALFFALAAVPIYLLARRFLARGLSATVAVLSLAIPSSIYVGLVLTESLAYLVSSVAIYAIVLALERPSVKAQLAALASIGLAYLVRPQFAVLYPIYVLALVILHRSELRRDRLRPLWPSLGSLALVLVGLLAVLLPGGPSVLGRYGDLWRSYDPIAVARWSAYYVGDLALYLGLIPFALLPAMLVAVGRRARAGSVGDAAFLAVFCGVNLLLLLVAGAFGTTPSSQGNLHDRYLFFVVPLWLVLGAVWVRDGAPRCFRTSAVGAILLLGVIAAFPFQRFVVDDGWRQLTAAATPLWSHFGSWSLSHGITGHHALGLVAVAAVVAAFLVPRPFAWTLGVPVAAVFVANAALLWSHGIPDSHKHVFAEQNSANRAWVDKAVPAGQPVTMLAIPVSCIGSSEAMSEFFNERVERVPTLGPLPEQRLPSTSFDVERDGKLVSASGEPLTARWLLVPRGVAVRGSPVATGTRQQLTLWRTRGLVVVHARSDRQLEAQACNGV